MNKEMSMVKVARVSTVPVFVYTFLRTQLDAIKKAGAQVTVITSPDQLMESMKSVEDYHFEAVTIERGIDLISDLKSLVSLIKVFHKNNFDIVHSNTPKAGLLSAIAAKLTGVPIRIHTFTGQRWVTMRGWTRIMLIFFDKLIGRLSTHCYADSFGQRDFLIAHKIMKPAKITVLGSGSLSGVDLTRFNTEKFSLSEKTELRQSISLDQDQLILLYLGRITKDKGVYELIESVGNLLKNSIKVSLLLVGPFEQNIEQEIRSLAKEHCGDKAIFTGFCMDPERYLAIADILCLPSYREGFGTVIIEAAAMGVPAVATRIYGLADAIVDDVTGILVEPRNVVDLSTALERLISDPELRERMGKNAKEHAISEFDSKKFDSLVVEEYKNFLNAL